MTIWNVLNVYLRSGLDESPDGQAAEDGVL